jgi:hypothetical protein
MTRSCQSVPARNIRLPQERQFDVDVREHQAVVLQIDDTVVPLKVVETEQEIHLVVLQYRKTAVHGMATHMHFRRVDPSQNATAAHPHRHPLEFVVNPRVQLQLLGIPQTDDTTLRTTIHKGLDGFPVHSYFDVQHVYVVHKNFGGELEDILQLFLDALTAEMLHQATLYFGVILIDLWLKLARRHLPHDGLEFSRDGRLVFGGDRGLEERVLFEEAREERVRLQFLDQPGDVLGRNLRETESWLRSAVGQSALGTAVGSKMGRGRGLVGMSGRVGVDGEEEDVPGLEIVEVELGEVVEDYVGA